MSIEEAIEALRDATTEYEASKAARDIVSAEEDDLTRQCYELLTKMDIAKKNLHKAIMGR